MRHLDFSPQGQARVVLVTIVGTLVCLAVAVLAVSYTTQFMDQNAKRLTWASAIVIPLVLSAPIFYAFAAKLRELAIAYQSLAIAASTDSLTSCLNRGAFVTLVDAYLTQVNATKPIGGALLVIDADHFKSINDRFGHSAGDLALKKVASTIKGTLRANDLVGRMGGEEFSVFLPAADDAAAEAIAERIRDRIEQADVSINEHRVPVSVSIGGVSFDGPVRFEDLFRAADARLYAAKSAGRNRVVFARRTTAWAA